MGFFRNLADEFGTKTGKALGNKLYGRHADDLRIGVGDNSGDGGGKAKTNKHDVEIAELNVEMAKVENETRQAEIETRRAEIEKETRKISLEADIQEKSRLRQLAKEIAAISFSPSDIEDNMSKLDVILPYAKLDPDKNTETKQLVDIAKTKFQTGLGICKQINPDHPMLDVYKDQLKEKKKNSFWGSSSVDEDDLPQVLNSTHIRNIEKTVFSSTDIDENISILNNLLVYFELNPDDYEERESMAIKSAQSKFRSGLAMSRAIAPNHPMIAFLQSEMTEKVEGLKQEKEKREVESKKSSKKLMLWWVAGIAILIIMAVVGSIFGF